MILRPYQERLVSRAVAALTSKGNTLAVAATGAGKTICLAAVAREIGGRQLVLQHRQELVRQNLAKFRLVNPDARCTIWDAERRSFRGDTTFAMVQSLFGHTDRMPRFDLLIADEAHHCAAPSWLKIIRAALDKNPDCKVIGFTATPSRSDKLALRQVFDNVCDQITTGELVRLGFLVPPRAYAVDVENTAQSLKAVSGSDWGEQSAIEAILNTDTVNGEVIRHWREKAEGRPTVVFCATVAHAKDVADAFNDAGIPAACVDGAMSAGARIAVLDAMTQGKIQVITNCMVLTEGWDYPPVSCVILLRKCSRKGPLVQMVGRGLRTVNPREFPGIVKKDCVVLDFGSSLITWGDLNADVVLDAREKDGKEEDKKGPAFKTCPECEAEIPLNSSMCPLCGHVFTQEEEPAKERVELTEIDILNDSQWRYVDLFGNGHAFMACGFDAWSGIFSRDGETWYAIGQRRKCRVENTLIGDRVQALAAADDFLRTHEQEKTAQKSCRWLDQPATDKQLELLRDYNCVPAPGTNKYTAACLLSFAFKYRDIARIIGVA